MKVIGILLLLLTLLGFYRPGGSIMCYYCPDETYSSDCKDVKNCTGTNTMCRTTVLSPHVGFPFQGDEVVTRGCARSTCVHNDPDALGEAEIVLCCQKDLCNNRGINATAPPMTEENNGPAQTAVTMGAVLLGVSVSLTVMWL
ncbi:secreted Ly-6/uPAR-related protein 1-like [Dendropsophus ebraccatus]|uniref:secreted Ly-6/uPAR-related protein 1-like n=1 Tax=Dendropsophus ebraccatus TaxID=150705 RepID=UPI00383192C9